MARIALSEIQQGTFGKKHPSVTFSAAIDEWYAREQRSRKSFRQVEQAMALHVMPYLGRRDLDRISKKDIMQVLDRIMEKGKLTQANRVRAFVTRFFNWAVERDLVAMSPASSLPKPAPEVSRDRVLTTNELCAVWEASEAIGFPFGPIVQILILTAQRRNEVAGMRWSELELERHRWVIGKDRSKNRKAHIVHLAPQAVEVLSKISAREGCDFVFSTNGKSAFSGFSKAKGEIDKRSGVADWRLHDLRRTAATYMTEDLKIAPAVVDRVLNHIAGSVRGVAAVYQRGEHLAEREAALHFWGSHVEGMLGANKLLE